MKLLKLIFSNSLIPRTRGYLYGVLSPLNSTKCIIFRSLKFSRKYIKWESSLIVYKNCRIEAVLNYESVSYKPLFQVGANVKINQNCHITFANRIEIGSDTSLASNVTITDIDHPYTDISVPVERQKLKISSVKIGKGCKIYNNAVILSGTIIGDHCVVGANSVVKGVFPDYSIIVGLPAKIVKRYNPESRKWEKTDPDGSFK